MSKTALLVEDDPILLAGLADIVEETLGMMPVMAASRRQALERTEADFGLAILDIELPDGTSFDVARKLMQRNVPTMFVSGSNPDVIPHDLRSVAFFEKPLRLSELIDFARNLPQ
jgi:DNA-binding response OmpR family regulator